MNAAIFGGLALVSLSRLLAAAASTRTIGQVVVLLLIAVLGYRYGKADRLLRVSGIVAFVVAWFWMPIVPLLALWALGTWSAKRQQIATPPVSAEPVATISIDPTPRDSVVNATMVLDLAAGEFNGRVRDMAVDFGSIYGPQAIPLLVDIDGREHGIYVETAEWDNAAKTRWYKWVAALRTSDREELPVIIRSRTDVPDDVSSYAAPSPRNSFELAGMMNVHWIEIPGFAELNASTLRRLAHEYFDIELGDDFGALERVDQLVVDRLTPGGRFLPSTVLLLGSFFGVVLLKELGGEWAIRGRKTSDVLVEIATGGGTVEANVFGKATKLLRNGLEDSMAAMARSLADRLR